MRPPVGLLHLVKVALEVALKLVDTKNGHRRNGEGAISAAA
jgi:hypothetical protein